MKVRLVSCIKKNKEIMREKILISIILTLCFVFGCASLQPDLNWKVSDDRTTVIGTLIDCDCSVAEIEMLVTNENTGKDYISTFTVHTGVRFERPVGVVSDWVSVDLKVTSTR